MKKIMLTGWCCVLAGAVFSQVLFTYGTDNVSKDEFINAFRSNLSKPVNKAASLREYLDLYISFKLKVKSAKEQKLDTLSVMKFDLMNFRHRLESDYPVDVKMAAVKTRFKRNPLVKDEELFRFADSTTLIPGEYEYPVGKKVVFTLSGNPVRAAEWLAFVKEYKLNYLSYRGENHQQLLDSFINKKIISYYTKNLEKYDDVFKHQLQLFSEGNLLYEVMNKKVWAKSASDPAALRQHYEANKDHFLWKGSADVILVTARYYAYADYAADQVRKGMNWRNIAATSEGTIQADSGRYELAHLPLKAGVELIEGSITDILKNNPENSSSFVKVIKIYPANQQRSFDEAKDLVINEYQQKLEQNWMNELIVKYPVKINEPVFNALVQEISK